MTTKPKDIREGRGLLRALDGDWFAESLVFASEAAYLRVKDQFAKPPRDVLAPLGPEYVLLDAQVRSLPEAPVVFGLGGGAALDAAKYYASENGARLVLVPGALSCGAAFRSDVLVRDGGVPVWVAGAAADVLLCDFAILESAPARVTRAGLGEFVALGLELALRCDGEPREGLAALRGALETLFSQASILGAWDEASLARLLQAHIELAEISERYALAPGASEVALFAGCLQGPRGQVWLWGERLILAALAAAMAQGLPLGPYLGFLNAAGGLPESGFDGLTEETWLAGVERFARVPTDEGPGCGVLRSRSQRLGEAFADLRHLLR